MKHYEKDGRKIVITSELRLLLKRWNDSGRVSFVYPRKKLISLNGGRAKGYTETLDYLREFFIKRAKS